MPHVYNNQDNWFIYYFYSLKTGKDFEEIDFSLALPPQ